MSIHRWVEELWSLPQYEGQFVHHQIIPPKPAQDRAHPDSLHPRLKALLIKQGVAQLYSHQWQALELLREGKNVAVMTPTGSGKSLIYHLAVLNEALRNPNARALYLFPLKALEQDQAQILQEMIDALGAREEIRIAVYDGDTPQHTRRKLLANPPHILISNPDMLHLSFLPGHETLRPFFQNLRYVVVDELSTYKGVFGSHFHQIMKRLHRVVEAKGAQPQLICCSASVNNAKEFATTLMGKDFDVITQSGAPQAQRHFLFMNPAASPYTEGANLFLRGIEAGLKTIAFTKARKITELVHTWVLQKAPHLRDRVSSYRAGYMPEERREIENKLFNNQLDGVISTSALEMGIDIGGLDLCLLIGYPGTVTSTWQRGGRVGRGQNDSAIVLIAQQDALDQYFMKNPHDFFGRLCENAIIDTHNREILKHHLVCAASEIPLGKKDHQYDFASSAVALRELEMSNRLLKSAPPLPLRRALTEGVVASATEDVWYSAQTRPHRLVNIRSVGGGFTIFDEESRAPIGEVGGGRAYGDCHPGAIYLHRGKQYQVLRMDLEHGNIYVKQSWENYFTQSKAEKDTAILAQEKMRSAIASTANARQSGSGERPAGNFLVKWGRLKVTERVVGYDKKALHGQQVLDSHTLDLPPVIFETMGLWFEIEQGIVERIQARGLHYMGAIHAAEHAMISLFPLFALCDRSDIGGISYPLHPQLGKSAIFIYDGVPGGIGLSERCYEVVEELMAKTLKLLQGCPCAEGCPSCVHSPKCGNGNRPLDKRAAIVLMEYLLGIRTLEVEDHPPHPALPLEGGGGTTELAIEAPPRNDKKPKILTFDIETQRGAEEVGGWNNTHLMRMAVGVVEDSSTGELKAYLEKDAQEMIAALKSADLVVGFNVKRFDYGVLRGYTDFDFTTLPTFDILEQVQKRLGHRISLDHLAKFTLKAAKSADGLQSLRWFKEGKMKEIIEYCKNDVIITRALFDFALQNKHLIYEKKNGPVVQLPLDWDLKQILERFATAPL